MNDDFSRATPNNDGPAIDGPRPEWWILNDLKLDEILKGIDKTECESEGGWWETSVGAKFGRNKKEQLHQRFDALRCILIEAIQALRGAGSHFTADEIEKRLKELE